MAEGGLVQQMTTGTAWVRRQWGLVFGGVACGGTIGCISGTALSGTIGYVTGRDGDAGGRRSQRRVYCREVAWRGKERPSTLSLLSASIVRTHSAEQSQPGASPRAQPIYIASGTPHNPSTPGLNPVTGRDGRGRDSAPPPIRELRQPTREVSATARASRGTALRNGPGPVARPHCPWLPMLDNHTVTETLMGREGDTLQGYAYNPGQSSGAPVKRGDHIPEAH